MPSEMIDSKNVLEQEPRMLQALQDLDERLSHRGVAPFELNVVGGFAMLLERIRRNSNDYTDIDYVGADLDQSIQNVVEEVGLEWGFGRRWVNNDVLLAGTSVEDLEYATGPLKFIPKLQMRVIHVNVLDKICLLRMKVIAVDTQMCAYDGKQMDRYRDFDDIKLLCDHLGVGISDIVEECEDWIVDHRTLALVNCYLKTGDDHMLDHLDEVVQNYRV